MIDKFLLDKKLNKNIPIPLYYQLKELLLEYVLIKNENTLLPTEVQLCELFQISRSTVRQALGELATDGFLIRHKGKGTMIFPRKIDQDFLLVLESFNDEMYGKGIVPHTKVLSFSLTEASPTVAKALGLEDGDPVVKLIRLRGADQVPMVLVSSFLPAEYHALENILTKDLEVNSLYQIMQNEYNIPIEASRRIIEIRLAGEFEAMHLKVPVQAPLQYIETVSTSTNNVPVEFSKASYRGDISRFVIEVRKKNL